MQHSFVEPPPLVALLTACATLGRKLAAVSLALLCVTVHTVRAQTGAIAGTVVAEGTLRPLPGAQIAVVGPGGKGAVSDASGRFNITGLAGASVILNIRLIGYRPATDTVPVGANSLRLALSERALDLNTIVVTGTADAVQKRELGTAVVSVGATDVLSQTAIANVEGLINGRAPGVNIIPASGQVGKQAAVRVRGLGTLSLSNTPLFFVDGIRVDNGRFNDFDPQQIENIDVLEGPAAATLYGTEAARGVINIITKKGAEGAPRWSFTQQTGALTFQDAEGRIPTNYWLPPGKVLGTDTLWHINFFESERSAGRDIFRNGKLNKSSVSVSGGSGLYRYFVAADINSTTGIDRQNALQQKGFRTNLSVVPSNKLDVETSVGYVTSRTNLAPENSNGGTFFSAVFSSPQYLPEACPFLYPAPRVVPRGCGWANGANGGNPPILFDNQINFTDIQRFTGSISVKYDPFPWLSQRFLVGTDHTLSDAVGYVPYQTDSIAAFFFGANFDGSRSQSTSPTTVNTYDYASTAHFDLRSNLRSKSTLGVQYYTTQQSSLSASGSHFPSPGLSTISATGTKGTPSSSLSANKTLGGYLQQEIALNDRLFVTGAMRVDNNSAFGSKAKLTTYPKVSVSWVASEEPSVRRWVPAFVNDLRVRGAYGGSGQQPSTNSALQTLSPIAGPGGATVLTYGSVGNANLKPERVLGTELGFETALWNDRLGIDFTYFKDISHDAIVSRAVAPSTGYTSSTFLNAGQINKSGIELALRGKVLDFRRFSWDAQFNVATAHSKIIKLTGTDTLVSGNRVGYSPSDLFTYKVLSATYDPATKKAINPMCDDANGGTTPCYAAGSTTIVAPSVFNGHFIPQTTGALTNTFTFGPFHLYAIADFQTGHTRLDNNLRARCQVFLTCLVNYYPADYSPAYVAQIASAGSLVSEFYKPADFFKLRNVALSYDGTQSLARLVRAKSLGITLTGQNLRTWTKYTGIDPESSLSGSSTDQTGDPQFTTYIISFRIAY